MKQHAAPAHKSYSPDMRKHACLIPTPAKIWPSFFCERTQIATHNSNICQDNHNMILFLHVQADETIKHAARCTVHFASLKMLSDKIGAMGKKNASVDSHRVSPKKKKIWGYHWNWNSKGKTREQSWQFHDNQAWCNRLYATLQSLSWDECM